MRIILTAAALVAAIYSTTASAQTYMQRCSWSHGSFVCLYSDGMGASPRVLRVPQYEPEEQLTEQERLVRRERSCASPSVVCLEAGR
jgi:hypothetical protein